jgi:hypothetical protein
LFQEVEQKAFDLIRKWNNYLFDTTDGLNEEHKIAKIGEEVEQSVKFHEPMQVMTQQEKEASIQTRLDLGLMTEKMAVKELYEVGDDKAEEILKEISESTFGAPQQESNQPPVAESNNNQAEGQPVKESRQGVNIQKLALNGAQVTSLIEIVQSVAVGNLPRDSGVKMIETAFNVDTQTAERIMSSSGRGFKPTLLEDNKGV